MNKLNLPIELQKKRANEAGLTLLEWQKEMNAKLDRMHKSAIESMKPKGKFYYVTEKDAERFQIKMDSAIY